MGCGMCGGNPQPTARYKVTLTGEDYKDYEPIILLTEIEARIYATEHGGGRIERIT